MKAAMGNDSGGMTYWRTHARPRPKPAMAGLAIRAGSPPAGYEAAFPVTHYSINWSDLEPLAGVYDFSPIDTALADADTRGVQAGIRVFAGQYSPAHVMAAAGTVSMTDAFDTPATTADVPIWWVPSNNLQVRYIALHAAIAAKYDTDARMREISAAMTTTIFAEPFMRQTGDATTRANLLAAGYTKAQDITAMHAMINAHKVYKATPTGIAFNPFQFVKTDGTAGTDVTVTTTMMDYARTILGDLAVLQQNSLDDPGTNVANEDTMYAHMQSLGGRVSFQTLASSRLTSSAQVTAMLEYAVSLGGYGVEFAPSGWTSHLSVADAESFNAQLIANAAAG